MKSRTSSCKAAAFKKDLTRFWPVWAGYSLCLVIIQIILTNDDLTYWYAANLAECIAVMGLVNAVYGLVVAQMLFGDLFNTRMCNGIHSLPLRRQEWFSVHILSGFLLSLVPTALMAGFSEIILSGYSEMINGWQLPLYWFAGANLQFLFFFGLGVFCVMCTGSRFAATVVYGIINFFATLVYVLVYQLYTPLLFGVVSQYTLFELLSPIVKLVALRCIDTNRVETGRVHTDVFAIEQREYVGSFTVQPQGWIYTLILAAVGIALLIAARQMYKKRHLECAGDFLAVRWLEPVFQVVFTVLCAAGFHGGIGIFFGTGSDLSISVIAIGLVVGWFAGRMFLERTTRVFRLKNFIGFGVMAALMAGSLFLTHLDPLGVDDWVPEAEDLKDGYIRMNYQAEFSSDDPQAVADIIRLHELALEQHITVHSDYADGIYNPYDNDPEAAQITFGYTLDNGMLAQRRYYILSDGESGEIMRKYFSRLETVLRKEEIRDLDDLRHEIKGVKRISINSIRVPEEFLTEEFLLSLADAIAADCDNGNLVQDGSFHTKPLIEANDDDSGIYAQNMDLSGENIWFWLDIYADCENILKVLEPTGVLDKIRAEYATIYG